MPGGAGQDRAGDVMCVLKTYIHVFQDVEGASACSRCALALRGCTDRRPLGTPTHRRMRERDGMLQLRVGEWLERQSVALQAEAHLDV